MYDLVTKRKWLTVAQLQIALNKLGHNRELECKRVGNIAIYTSDREFLGFIDFVDGTVEFFNHNCDKQSK